MERSGGAFGEVRTEEEGMREGSIKSIAVLRPPSFGVCGACLSRRWVVLRCLRAALASPRLASSGRPVGTQQKALQDETSRA